MIRIAVSFLSGILVFQFVPLPPVWSVFLMAAGSIVLFKYFPKGSSFYIATAGFIWVYIHASVQLHSDFAQYLQGQDIELTGVVSKIQNQTSQYTRFILNTTQIDKRIPVSDLSSKLMLSWYNPESVIKVEQSCSVTVRLKSYWRFANPGSADIEKTMFLQGIAARGYVTKGICLETVPDKSQPVSLRDQLIEKFTRQKKELDYFGWMMALSFGNRDYLTAQDWQVLRQSGTAHLVAISGLHLSVIAMFAYFLAYQLTRLSVSACERFGAQRIAAVCAMLVVCCYAYIAGFSIPTQRALIMVCIALTAVILNKPVCSFPLLATTLLITLLWQPLSVLTASFWMTFVAVLAIFLIIKSSPKVNKWWLILRIQILLAVALFPISLWFFQEGSLISPLVNLLAVPYISFLVLPLLLTAQVLFILDFSVCNALFDWLDYLLNYFWQFIQASTRFTFSSYHFQPVLTGVILFQAGWLLFIFAREWIWRLMAIVLCASLILIRPDRLDNNQLRLSVLDVGQGLSAIIETRQHALLYDVGPQYPSGFNTSDAVVLPYLRYRSINYVDKLVISHHDNDHAGGLEMMLASGLVAELLVGHAAEHKPSIPAQDCLQGRQWIWDNTQFNVLHPPADWHARKNNSSCVIQIFHPAATILLTGDIEAEVEYRLLAEFGDKLRSDILIVPHHGSLSSSTPAFLEAVAPKFAIYSAGYRNRYGFPHATIQARYRAIGARQLNTAQEGAIVFELDVDKGIQQRPGYRRTSHRYWHAPIKN